MNYSECIEQARKRIGNYCKACPECNGKACRNQMPGPGSKGIGDTAIRNYDKWKEIRLQMDTIAENKPVDTSLELFDKTFQYPFFAGPVGAVQLHYGDCQTDVTYNDILVSACAEYGIAAFTGDGIDSNVMVAATKAIQKTDGIGIPTVKPWNLDTIKEKMDLVHASKAFAVAMDIDAAGLPFLKNLDPPAGSKTVEELRQIIKLAGTPFIVKGIMTVKGALKAKEAGLIDYTYTEDIGYTGDRITALEIYNTKTRAVCFRMGNPTNEPSEPEEPSIANERIKPHEARVIKRMLEESESDIDSFLGYYNVEKVEDMTEADYVDASRKLNKKLEGMKR